MGYKWLALTVTTIGVLMVGIDTRIVIIGLPQVSEQLGADIEQAIWITQAYVLTNTLMLSRIGRLGDIFGTLWARRQLKETALLDTSRRIDWVGFALFTAFLFCLMVGLTFVAYGTRGLTTAYTLLISAAVLITVFIAYERKVKYPLIYLWVFRTPPPDFGGIVRVTFQHYHLDGCASAFEFAVSIGRQSCPLETGLKILPFEIAFLAVGPLSGKLEDKYGQTQFTLTCLVLSIVALFLFSTTGQGTPYVTLSLYMVLLGVGTGLFVAPNLRAIMISVSTERHGVGSALFTLFLNIGLTVSLNLTVLIMSLTAPTSSSPK